MTLKSRLAAWQNAEVRELQRKCKQLKRQLHDERMHIDTLRTICQQKQDEIDRLKEQAFDAEQNRKLAESERDLMRHSLELSTAHRQREIELALQQSAVAAAGRLKHESNGADL